MSRRRQRCRDLLFQLRTYLGATRFQWLCACAIFPAISPAMTLALGRELSTDPRDLALGLAAIGALPWFRHGFLPAWLRLELIDHLDAELEARFRAIVEKRLDDAIEAPGVPLVNIAAGVFAGTTGDSPPTGSGRPTARLSGKSDRRRAVLTPAASASAGGSS